MKWKNDIPKSAQKKLFSKYLLRIASLKQNDNLQLNQWNLFPADQLWNQYAMKSKEDHRWFPVFVLKVNKKLALLSVKEDDYSLN